MIFRVGNTMFNQVAEGCICELNAGFSDIATGKWKFVAVMLFSGVLRPSRLPM